MTNPMPTDSEVRSWFSEMRKLVAYPTAGPRICRLEELVVELIARERNVPTIDTLPDGYPSGGSSGARSSDRTSSTERAATILADGDHTNPDPTGTVVLHLVDFLRQAGQSARIVKADALHAEHLSSLRKKPVGQTAEDCQQEDCTNLATRKGNCDACRQYLKRHPEVRVVPREVIAQRNRPRYESGPYADAS